MNEILQKDAADWRNGPPDSDLDYASLAIRRDAIQRRLAAVAARIHEIGRQIEGAMSAAPDQVIVEEPAKAVIRRASKGPIQPRERSPALDVVAHLADSGLLEKVMLKARKSLSTREVAERCLALCPPEIADQSLSEVSKRLSGKLNALARKGVIEPVDGERGREWRRLPGGAAESSEDALGKVGD